MAAADAQHELTRVPTRLDPMSDADEVAMGREMASQISAHLGSAHANPSHDAAIQDYLQSVGRRVIAHSRRRLPWTFHYVPSQIS
jgi:beta-barrel assembly-enhancing protease